MAKFALFSTLTIEERQSLHHNRHGRKVLAQYALLGNPNFIAISETRDSVTAAHLAVDVGSRGTATSQQRCTRVITSPVWAPLKEPRPC